MVLSKSQVAAILLSCTSVSALNVWDQCGGIGWTGSGTCPAGSSCVVSNPYYSQCLPGASTTTAKTTSTTTVKSTSTTTKTTTTTSGKPTVSTTTKTTLTTSVKPTVTTTTSASASPTAPSSSGVKYIFSFGDSYTQTGFDITSTEPSVGNPLGNPPYPGYTTSGGANWIDLITEKYNMSITLTYNFAYGGATVNASLVAPYTSTVLSLIDQVNEFTSSVASKPSYAPWTSSDALFTTFLGVNDVGNSYYLSNYNDLVPQIIASYFNEQQILYNAGARKFLFLTVPPIQDTPLMISQGASVQANEASAITTFNNALSQAAANFKAQNAGVTIYIYDTQTPFLKVINNPTAYGAANNTCFDSSGSVCIWFNNYHPGLAIQDLVAQGVAATLGNW